MRNTISDVDMGIIVCAGTSHPVFWKADWMDAFYPRWRYKKDCVSHRKI